MSAALATAPAAPGLGATLRQALAARWRFILGFAALFTLAYYALLMGSLMLRFGAAPNYIVFYDWIGSVATIIRSTPSWSDMAPIIWEEWLIEIGRMNYDYGLGISEWSLNILPSKTVMTFLLGALIGANIAMLRARPCSLAARGSANAATGLGALMVAVTNATMSWVVCCATPSWIVGLAMLGLGVSTSNALEPIGPWLSAGGFLLLIATLLLSARAVAAPAPADLRLSKEPSHA